MIVQKLPLDKIGLQVILELKDYESHYQYQSQPEHHFGQLLLVVLVLLPTGR